MYAVLLRNNYTGYCIYVFRNDRALPPAASFSGSVLRHTVTFLPTRLFGAVMAVNVLMLFSSYVHFANARVAACCTIPSVNLAINALMICWRHKKLCFNSFPSRNAGRLIIKKLKRHFLLQ